MTDQILTVAVEGPQGPPGPASPGRTPILDASYRVVLTDRTISFVSLGARRTITLPLAADFPLGVPLFIVDESGSCSTDFPIIIAASGTDKINGAASINLINAYGSVGLICNGIGSWTILQKPDAISNTEVEVTGFVAAGMVAGTDPVGYQTPGYFVSVSHEDNVMTVRSFTASVNGQSAIRLGDHVGWERAAMGYGNIRGDDLFDHAAFVEISHINGPTDTVTTDYRIVNTQDGTGVLPQQAWVPFEVFGLGGVAMRASVGSGAGKGHTFFTMTAAGQFGFDDVAPSYLVDVAGVMRAQTAVGIGGTNVHMLADNGPGRLGLTLNNGTAFASYMAFTTVSSRPMIDGPGGELALGVGGAPVAKLTLQGLAIGAPIAYAPQAALDVFGITKLGAFTVATLPANVVGGAIFVSNARKVGQGAGGGTGVVAAYSDGAWRRLSDDMPVAA